jgi:hypothetical protein
VPTPPSTSTRTNSPTCSSDRLLRRSDAPRERNARAAVGPHACQDDLMRSSGQSLWPGRHTPLGATWDGRGTNFALWCERAEAVQLCLLDEAEREASDRGSATATA